MVFTRFRKSVKINYFHSQEKFRVKNYTVKTYQQTDFEIWNEFVSGAKNATFLFHRNFMEYHQERFSDCSLMVYESDRLVALLPANRNETTVFSHQGLTYGGLVYKDSCKLTSVIAAFAAILKYLESEGIATLQIKTLPSIYHKKPAEELHYALFLTQATLSRRDVLAVIDCSAGFALSKIRKRGLLRAKQLQLEVKEEQDFNSFWNEILLPNLKQRHQVDPVHTTDEIHYLKSCFPQAIRQFNVYYEGVLVAGTTVFETETVAHCQYISKYEKGLNLGSLDFLYHYLLTEVYADKRFFDFGISTESNGLLLNEGLSYWKESFGASAIMHDFYECETVAHELLTNYFTVSKNADHD